MEQFYVLKRSCEIYDSHNGIVFKASYQSVFDPSEWTWLVLAPLVQMTQLVELRPSSSGVNVTVKVRHVKRAPP